MNAPLQIYIGYDPQESVAYHTLCHSIITQSSVPVAITPVYTGMMSDFFYRKRDEKQSNDFSYSRFLVPYMSGFRGWCLYMDCDMLLRGDIAELFEESDPTKSVLVVKHEYIPNDEKKFLGNKQYKYEKKNWSSLMLFNCNHFHVRGLTVPYVDKASGLDLHQFKWTEDHRIGELSREWNWLVGEYKSNPDAKIVHFTVGGPYFAEYKDCDYSAEWMEAYRKMKYCKQLPVPMIKVSAR